MLDHVVAHMHVPPPSGDGADDASEDAEDDRMQTPPDDTID